MQNTIETKAAKATETKAAPVKAAPAKPAKAAERAAFAERIAAERASASQLFAAFDAASVSVPVKPLAAFLRSYKRDISAHAIGRKPSVRQAAALAVACLAGGKPVKNGSTFKRKFDHAGTSYAIENGALSDCLASGLATYNAKTETITIRNAAEIASHIGAATSLAI